MTGHDLTFRPLLCCGAVLLGLALLPTLTADAQTFRVSEGDRYEDCVRDISIDPRRGYEKANRWRMEGGGAAAMHCEALGLSEMGAYTSAGKMLERLAALPDIEEEEERATIYLQAGHAWILADRADRALGAFGEGLTHVNLQDNPLMASDLKIGRAHAFGLKEDWKDALKELDAVLEVLPQQYDALLLRASMRRADGDIPGAAGDLAAYLTLLPDEVDGLMERGFLRMEVGDLRGAQVDFQRVMDKAPESRAALQAQAALSKIAFRLEER